MTPVAQSAGGILYDVWEGLGRGIGNLAQGPGINQNVPVTCAIVPRYHGAMVP